MGTSRTTPRRPAWAAAAVAATMIAGLVPFAASAPAFAASDAADTTPENIVLTPAEHADTAQAFTWRTGADVTEGQVHLRQVGTQDWRIVDARANTPLLSAGVSTRTHSVTIDGLTANTEYEYFVGSAAETSDTYTFTTAGAAGEDFSFIYFGDAQNNLTERWAPVVKSAFERFPDAVGTVNAGDLVNTGGNDSEWTEWFGAMDGFSQTRNVIAAPGNHEYGGDEFLSAWKANFEYPADGPVADATDGMSDGEKQTAAYEAQMEIALAETAYYTDYQGVRFISLNASREQAVALMTPEDLPPCSIACPNPSQLWLDMQADWLDDILVNNPNKWSAVVFHQPVFSTAEGRDESDVREAWLPVFQRNDIDLVLMGHDHTYSRGYVNTDATDTPGITTGPVYTVAVSGPKYYEMSPEDDNVWTQNGATQVVREAHTSTFQGIHVSKDQIRYESIVGAKWDDESTTDKAVGDTLDAFTITKYDNGEKYVTEDGVPIPPQSGPDGSGDGPAAPEEPAGEPADVPLGHEVIGTFDAPTATEPGATTVNPSTGVVYVADRSADGAGKVEAIDPKTGEVLGSFEAGAPIRDLSFDAAFNGLLVTYQDGKIGSFVAGLAALGTVYGPTRALDLDTVAMQYDAYTGKVLAASADGTFATIDGTDVVDPVQIGAGVSSIRLDDITGVLYVTYNNAEDGQVGLRLYETRNDMNVLAEYNLDAGASALDIDMEKGIAYVGHREAPAQPAVMAVNADAAIGGLSVVDLINETVTRYDAPEFGTSIAGVGVDAEKGIVYLSSADKTPAPMIVVGRQQAPSIVSSPVATTADAGETVSFSATGRGVPAPTVSWESRVAGSETWSPVEGATSDTLEVTASDAIHGTQYRAVYSNSIAEQEYSTRSASATLRIAGFEAPGENPGGEGPGTEQPGTDQPGADQPGAEQPGSGPRGGDLASTGAEPWGAAFAAVLMLLAGAVVVVTRRRRVTQK